MTDLEAGLGGPITSDQAAIIIFTLMLLLLLLLLLMRSRKRNRMGRRQMPIFDAGKKRTLIDLQSLLPFASSDWW